MTRNLFADDTEPDCPICGAPANNCAPANQNLAETMHDGIGHVPIYPGSDAPTYPVPEHDGQGSGGDASVAVDFRVEPGDPREHGDQSVMESTQQS